jgi:hypothetical protein
VHEQRLLQNGVRSNLSLSPNQFKILVLNIQSLGAKINELEAVAIRENPDFICICEHWLRNITVTIPGYVLGDSFCRKKRIHGGVVIFVKRNIQFCNVSSNIEQLNDEQTFECSAVKYVIEDQIFIVLILYRSPTGCFESFIEKLENLLFTLTNHSKRPNIILTGDLNCNLLKDGQEQKQLLSVFQRFNMKPLVNTPTRITMYSKTLLDNVFTDQGEENTNTTVFDTGLSDHLAIVSTFKVHRKTILPKPVNYRRFFVDDNVNYFRLLLSQQHWDGVKVSNSLNDNFNYFYSRYMHCFDIAFPIEPERSKSNGRKNWLTPEIIRMSNYMKYMSLEMLSSEDHLLQSEYSRLKRHYKYCIKKAKKECNDQRIKNASNYSKEAWSIIKNNSTSNSTITVNHMRDDHGNVITDDIKIANVFNDIFLQTPVLQNNVHHLPSQPNFVSCSKSLFLKPCDKTELQHHIAKVGGKKSTDADELSGKLILQSADIILDTLLTIVNQSLSEGIYPDALKISKVIPVFKNKGDRNEFNNYRPISIIPQFGKILEYVFCKRLVDYLESHNLLNANQFGYRKARSTEQALFKMVDHILNHINERYKVMGIFCDLSKAFDIINHEKLIKKCQLLGIRGVALNWMKTYLAQRHQKVAFQNNGKIHLSTPQKVVTGVPQGSVLGPILFLIFINDLPLNLGSSVQKNCIIFADDVSIVTPGKTIHNLITSGEHVLKLMLNWCNSNNQILNCQKTQAVCFAAKNNKSENYCQTLKDNGFNSTENIKFLGIYLDQHLKWDVHVSHLCKNLNSVFYLVSVLKHTVSFSVLRTLYYGLFNSKVTYGIIIWGTSPLLNNVFIIQKKLIRSMYNMSYRAHCKPIFKSSGILTVPSVFIYHSVLYVKKHMSEFKSNNSVHSHKTRHCDDVHMSVSNLWTTLKGPYPMCIKLYNHLPDVIKREKRLSEFRTLVLRYLQKHCFYKVNDYLTNNY